MKAPHPEPEHQRLEPLSGLWKGEEWWHPSPLHPDGRKAGSRTTGRIELDGFALIQNYEQLDGKEVVYRSHSILRWDKAAEEYVLHAYDNHGNHQVYKGGFDDGRFTLEGEGPAGQARSTFQVREGSTILLYEILQKEGRWSPLMEAIYTRSE
jgi:hypothetical protein